MAGEYKSACGCRIHVAQWTSKRKIVTQESCLLHKAAAETLAERDTLQAENTRLREALRAMLKLLDEGKLVRNISGDGDPGWATK